MAPITTTTTTTTTTTIPRRTFSRTLGVVSTSQSMTTDLAVLDRAWKIGQILIDKVVGPGLVALLKSGWPTDEEQWNDFWLTNTITDNKTAATNHQTLAQRVVVALEEMGPTYVKLGQALSSRPDIIAPTLSQALQTLQDQMQPFENAKQILEQELPHIYAEERASILQSLSDVPVAAASVGQVYSARLPNQTKVAIKVQRPDIQDLVQQDAQLFLQVASALESLQVVPGQRLIQADLTGAIQEFMSRLEEELDYTMEARNLQEFAALYCHRRPPTSNQARASVQVVVPQLYPELCTSKVLVMEWIDGTKLVNLETEQSRQESLELIRQGIDCTLSQLLETGVLHADPHGGNLWKYQDPITDTTTTTGTDTNNNNSDKNSPTSPPRLAYVDFGLVAKVPVQVRDGLVCAVAELVFERNATAVANLFGELALIPPSVLSDPVQMDSLGIELKKVLDEVLLYPANNNNNNNHDQPTGSTTIPQLRFDKLINALTTLLPRFQFQLPPYFLNNVRALGTLEGMAREIQPDFNVLQYLYPYALDRILANPSASPVVEATLEHLITNQEEPGRIDPIKIQRLLRDMALWTGIRKRQLIRDILQTRTGQHIAKRILKESLVILPRRPRRNRTKRRMFARQVPTRLFRL